MLMVVVGPLFHKELTFARLLIIHFLSWVKRHALPDDLLVTLANSLRSFGYKSQLSFLEPTLFPKGRSEAMTSIELSFRGR